MASADEYEGKHRKEDADNVIETDDKTPTEDGGDASGEPNGSQTEFPEGTPPVIVDKGAVIADYVRGQLQGQSWWRKSANTVTTAVTGLVALVWWITTTGIDLPTWTTWVGGVVLVAGQVVGVRMTKNGVTWQEQGELERASDDTSLQDLFATLAGR